MEILRFHKRENYIKFNFGRNPLDLGNSEIRKIGFGKNSKNSRPPNLTKLGSEKRKFNFKPKTY